MFVLIQFAPPSSGKRQARSGGRKPGAACCQRVAVAWVGRPVVRFGGDVLMPGRVIVWRICSAGVAVSEIVSGLSYHAHARARAASRRPCDNVYIIARHNPRPGCFSSLFELSKARGAPISSLLPLFPSKKLPLPHFLHLHFLKHITMPLSLKISPTIEFLSFRQANYALNPKQTLLRDFKGIARNQRGTAQSTTY